MNENDFSNYETLSLNAFQDLDSLPTLNAVENNLPPISNLLSLLQDALVHKTTENFGDPINDQQILDFVPSKLKSLKNLDIYGANTHFVQSHTSDVQLSKKYPDNKQIYTNKTCQTEIKSELKPENLELANQRLRRLGSPRSPHGCISSNEVNLCSSDTTSSSDETSGAIFELNEPLHKCSYCSFISLNELDLSSHSNSLQCRINCKRTRLICPGCENTFYSAISFESHLREDHLISLKDIQKIKDAFEKSTTCKINFQYDKFINEVDLPVCLEQESTNNHQSYDHISLPSGVKPLISRVIAEKPLQNMSMKSVDVLRKPDLIYRENEIENLNISFNGFNDINLHDINPCEAFVNNIVYADNLDVDLIHNEAHYNTNNDYIQNQRQQKIYIKNDDVLKNPSSLNLTITGQEISPSNSDYMVQSVLEFENNLLSDLTSIVPFSFSSDQMDKNIFNIIDINLDQNSKGDDQKKANTLLGNSRNSAESIFENNLKTIPICLKPENFIKNVGILKKPHQSEQRATLTVHTVAELNLMNKNEVKNLMAPNLETTQTFGNVNKTKRSFFIDTLPKTNMPKLVCESYENEEEILVDLLSYARKTITEDEPQISSLSIHDIEELSSNNNVDVVVQTLNSEHSLIENKNKPHVTVHLNAIAQNSPSNTQTCLALNHDMRSNELSTTIERTEVIKKKNSSIISSYSNFEAISSPVSVFSSNNNNNMDIIPPLIAVSSVINPLRPREQPNSFSTSIPPLMSVPPLIFTKMKPRNTCNNKSHHRNLTSCICNRFNCAYLRCKKEIKNCKTQPCDDGRSIRGRPYGPNRLKNDLKLLENGKKESRMFKCLIKGCAFRFKTAETLEYHERCHINEPLANSTRCPECKTNKFTNWNTLHTHLWRTHKIDMELYSCDVCNFKTPVFSRLQNIHSKIHLEERNFKCEQCTKAFKNTKQLKNHRRWHRNKVSHVADLMNSSKKYTILKN